MTLYIPESSVGFVLAVMAYRLQRNFIQYFYVCVSACKKLLSWVVPNQKYVEANLFNISFNATKECFFYVCVSARATSYRTAPQASGHLDSKEKRPDLRGEL